MKLLKVEDVAEILQISPRIVRAKYAHSANFPTPIRLPSPKGQGVLRWKQEDIINWINKLAA